MAKRTACDNPRVVTTGGDAPDEASDATARLAQLIAHGDADGAVALARALHPAELASALSGIDGDVRELVLERLAPPALGTALGYIEPHYRGDLLIELPPQRIAAVLEAVPHDVAADVVGGLPPDVARQVVAAMPDEARRAVGGLLEHDTETAGGRMTVERVAVRPERTVAEVIDFLRSLRPDVSQPFYVYVTNEWQTLIGVLNLRSLLTAAPETPVSELMQEGDVVSVAANTDQEEAARLFKRYRLLALPVVDGEGHLLGTIMADDLVDVLEDEATEDMYRIVGVDEAEDLRGVLRSVRFRLPWLSVNLLTVLAAAYVIQLFEGTLERVAVLAAFLPVVAGMGGNAGIQTLTVVVRSLALGRLTPRHTLQVVGHELAAGLLTGFATGAAVAAVAWGWQANPWLGAVVGVALMGNVLVGVTAGVLIPMGLHRLRQDPALSAGIWLTTATDVLGFLGFLGLATVLLSRID